MSALDRHPFMKWLLKLAASIFVGWNALMLAMWGPFIALILILLPFTNSSSQLKDDTSLESVYGNGSQELLSLRIDGPISGDQGSGSPFDALSTTYGYDIKQKLANAASNEAVKGVVLEINSPGGTIYGAHAIADGVEYYRRHTGKPIYAYIQGLGASGAYWAAASTDRIIADYGSDIGSIGVIMGPFKYYDHVISESGSLFENGVITQNGIQNIMITAGRSKDLGSPYRKLTPDELTELQTQVNHDYDLFVGYVSNRRHIPAATIRDRIGALAYDNTSAQQLGLIDSTSSREDTYEALAKAAHIQDNYQVMREQSKTGFLYTLLGAITGQPNAKVSTKAGASASHCYDIQAHLAYAGDVTSLCGQ